MCLLGVVSLAAGCRHLQVVYLRRCVNVGDEAIIALASHCRQLRDLNIGGCTLVTDASLQALAEHASQLSSINFSRADVCSLTSNLLIVSYVSCLLADLFTVSSE